MDFNKSKMFLVGKDNNCNFNTIQEALDNVEENSIIQIKPGVYNEHLNFTKKVHLIGCNDSIKNKSSNELPIVVLDSDKSCEIEVSVKIEGIVFTHKKDLQFDSISSFMKNSLEFEKKSVEDFKSLLWVKAESNFSNIAILCSEENGIAFSDLKSNLNNSFIFHVYSSGIYIAFETETIISDCIIADTTTGVFVSNSATPKISHCLMEKNEVGIFTDENANPNFIFCEIKASGLGVYLKESSKGLYEKCTIHNNRCFAIIIDDKSNPTIKDCEIFGNKDGGIFINGDSNSQIIRSSIYNNDNGLFFGGKTKININLCEIYDNNFGIDIEGDCIGTFENCLIYNNKKMGMLIDGNNNPIVDLIIEKCKILKNEIGILTSAKKGSLQIKESEICENSDIGIQIDCQLTHELYENCNIYNNNTGIYIIPSYKPNFNTCKVYNNFYKNINSFAESSEKVFNTLNNKN